MEARKPCGSFSPGENSATVKNPVQKPKCFRNPTGKETLGVSHPEQREEQRKEMAVGGWGHEQKRC